MKIKNAHIAISVADLERTSQFYSKYFDFTKKTHYQINDSQNKTFEIAILQHNGIEIEVFHFPNHTDNLEPKDEQGLHLQELGLKHIAFYVEDIQKMWHKMNENNVHIENQIDTFENGDKYFFIKDPDKIIIEIMEKHNNNF